MAFVWSEDNTREVKRAIRAGADLGLKKIANETEEQIDEGFDTGHDALGKPWKPLAPSTIRKKGHSQILVDSGHMRESLYSDTNFAGNSAQVGFTDGTIRFHEFGVPENNLPARPVLGPAVTYASNITDWKMKSAFDDTFDSMVD